MITTLTGENGFKLQQELRRVVDDFTKEHGDLALTQLDGEEASFDQMREALASMPFLASKKLVVLRMPSAQKEFTEKAKDLLEALGDETDVIIVEPKLDKRSSYYKYLKSHTEFQEFGELDANGLSRWLADEAKRCGGTLSSADARYLVERVGANQQLLSNELEKLIVYDAAVTKQTIDLLTEPMPQSTIFQLLDALFAGDSKRASQLYDEQRRLKVEPQQIIAMLAWQLHVLALVKTAGNQSETEIARSAKLSPFVVGKTRRAAARLSLAELKKLVAQVLAIDEGSKTGALDPDEALRNLLISPLSSA